MFTPHPIKPRSSEAVRQLPIWVFDPQSNAILRNLKKLHYIVFPSRPNYWTTSSERGCRGALKDFSSIKPRVSTRGAGFTVIKKILIFFCALILTGSSLFAQNEAMLLKVAPLPEKESMPPVPLPVEKSILDVGHNQFLQPKGQSLPEIDTERLLFILDLKSKVFWPRMYKFYFPPFMFSKNQSRLSTAYVEPYEKSGRAFLGFIDKRIHEDTVKKRDEQKTIREAWKEWLGIDIWYPYFKAKEIERWVCDRFKVKIFNFRGRLKFEKNEVRYTFKMRF
jgi:hypothetical protein